jgi:hypothetical protein
MGAWSIDADTKRCQLKAETGCHKLKMGGVQFSLATMIPRYEVFFWKIAIQRHKGFRVAARLWSWAKIKAGITVLCATLSLEDMQTKLSDSYASYKLAKKSHEASRLSFAANFTPKVRDRILRNEEA